MIIPQDWRDCYHRSVIELGYLSRGYYKPEAYEVSLMQLLELNANFKRAVFEEIEEALQKFVPLDDQKECFEMCVNYGFLEPIKLLVAKTPSLLHETYGNPPSVVSDVIYRIISDYKAKELFDKPEFTVISAGFKETLDYFTKICNIPVTQVLMAAQIAAGINPRESVENRAVLVSVIQSIENLLNHYQYLEPGAAPPSKTSFYDAFKSWVADLKRTRGQEVMIQDAVQSFEAVLEAKTDLKSYMESTEKTRKTLYGVYRHKDKFNIQDVFALMWQTLQTEITDVEERQGYLERWIEAMQEATHAHDLGRNPVIGFEDTTHGCSSAMIHPSIGILATIESLSKTGIVQVNYVNSATMGEKAFFGFFADNIEAQWNQADLTDRTHLRRQLQRWAANPGMGVPEELYTKEVKAYIAEQLKEECKTLIPETELRQITEQILEHLGSRGELPWRVKRLLMQDFVQEFVEQCHLDVATLQAILGEAQSEKATPETVWGNKAALWMDFLKNKLMAISPRLSDEEKQSYSAVVLEAIRKTLLKLVAEKDDSSIRSVPAVLVSAVQKMPADTHTTVLEAQKTVPSSTVMTSKPAVK